MTFINQPIDYSPGPGDYLIDLGWLRLFEGPRWTNLNSISKRTAASNTRAGVEASTYEEILKVPTYLEILSFLEILVITEHLAIDAIAAQLAETTLPNKLSALIFKLRPTKETYRQAFDATLSAVRQLKASELSTIPACLKTSNPSSEDPWWSGVEKEFHDALFEANKAEFADSNDSLPRALFYFEFAKTSGLSLLPSAEKRRWYDLLQQPLADTLHAKIGRLIDKAVVDRLGELGSLLRGREISVPPLAELILRRSLAERREPLDVALDLRASKEAKGYREFLSAVAQALKEGTRPAQIEAARMLAGLKTLADGWAATLDVKTGVTHKRRTLKFSKIPMIGPILELAGMSDISINDPILNPSLLNVFISQWYSDSL